MLRQVVVQAGPLVPYKTHHWQRETYYTTIFFSFIEFYDLDNPWADTMKK